MTALSSLDDIDLTQLSSTVTQLKAKFDILTTNLRTSKLHRSLLSHILWYVREKAVLHKVLSIWVDRTDLNLQSNDSEQNHKTKFRKVAKVARQWIQRKSSVSGVNNRCTTPPELRRASVLLKSSSDVAPNVCDTEATSQDLACINSIRVLQKWLEVDQMAKDDIVSDLTQLGYSRQISYIPLEGASMGMETIDLLPTLSNIVRIIKANGSENQQVGKNSYFSTYLSQLVTPGELVKSLKVNLSNSLQHDMGSVYPLLSTSSSSTISAGENIGNNNFIQHQEMTTQDLPFMPPPLQSNPSLKTNSSVTHTSSNTHTNTNANSISQTTLHPESEPIHALPSPPLDSGNRNHRPTAREKRINSNFYTKQYTDSNGAYSDIEFEQTEIREPSNARFILRDGTPAKSHTGEKITILTPQDRLTLSTMTPQKPTKLGDLKPSPPKGSPDALHSLPEPNDGFSPGKGRFVRQSLLRQRSSNSEEAQSILKTEDEIGNKNTQRSSILIGGGIQHGAYTQPSPPSKVQYSNIRPHSRGRVVGHESAGGGKGLSELMDITAELDELKEKENEDKFSSITIPPTTTGGGIGGSWAGSGSGSAGAMTEQQMELEQRRLHHLNNVVGQLLDDEESLLAELESEHLALSAGLCPSRKFPITDPLIPNTSPRSKGLSTQQHNHHQQQHTPVYFPDPNAKLKTTSYTATLSQRKEKDHLVLQAIANADSVHFSDVTLNGKSVGAKQHHRESNEENRTFFPGIY